ncbi:MAG: dihydropyrimidinase [Clostridium perfringens]|nr:dihydropyrimidinase [Clostridium perfringens]
MGTVLKGAYIVTSKEIIRNDLRIDGEKIESIGLSLEKDGDEIIDLKGSYILPGGIDAHTHFDLELPNIKTSDDFNSGTKAAIAGGTTTIIDFVNCHRGEKLSSALEVYKEKTKDICYSDYGFHMTLCEWNKDVESEMEDMVKQGITSFKMYMAYKDTLQVNEEEIEQALRKAKELGVLISFHCENGDEIIKNINDLLEENKSDVKYHEISRSSEVEYEAVNTLIKIATKINYPIYIVHLSSKMSLDAVRKARQKGVKIFVETCPHYLLLDKSYYELEKDEELEGAKYVMSPPLRSKEDNKALWIGIKLGEIDTIATDHCSFNKIPNGIPSVEHRMELIFSYGVEDKKISLNEMVQLTSTNPAKIFGLYPKKGEIKEGSDADLLIIEADYDGVISHKDSIQEVDYTPYEGFKSNGKIKRVFLRGKELVKDGKFIGKEPTGQYISRKKWSYEGR